MSAKHAQGHVPEDCSVERCPECAVVFAAREAKRKRLPMGDPTPGPWQYVVNGRGYDLRTVTAGLGEPLASRVMRAPDVRLLAAAPDLLMALEAIDAACTDALNALRQSTDRSPTMIRAQAAATLRDGLQSIARAAIAKARGDK